MPERSSPFSLVRPSDDIFEPTVRTQSIAAHAPSTLSASRLNPFPNHPFQVRHDEDFFKLVASIKKHGVKEPVICRPDPSGNGYQIISGHRRVAACKAAGIIDIPVTMQDMNDIQATLVMIDANLHREKILPSEKAFSYKMKVEALNRVRGETGLVVSEGKRATEIVGEEMGENYRNVMRYIRLTFLEKPLLDILDDGKLKLHPAVELSYLKQAEQATLYGFIQDTRLIPSLQQAKMLKQISQNRVLTGQDIENLMLSRKDVEKAIIFKREELQPFFSADQTPEQIKTGILELLEARQRTLGRER